MSVRMTVMTTTTTITTTTTTTGVPTKKSMIRNSIFYRFQWTCKILSTQLLICWDMFGKAFRFKLKADNNAVTINAPINWINAIGIHFQQREIYSLDKRSFEINWLPIISLPVCVVKLFLIYRWNVMPLAVPTKHWMKSALTKQSKNISQS